MNINGKSKLCGVIGSHIEHSKSPTLHNYWLNKYDCNGVYIPLFVADDKFDEALKSLELLRIHRANVTAPHKESAFANMHTTTNRAKLFGSVNLMTFENGKWHGDSTDGWGLVAGLKYQNPNFENEKKVVLVIGAGGSAKSIVYELLHEDNVTKVIVANRTIDKAYKLQELFSNEPDKLEIISLQQIIDIEDTVDILIHTTTVGSDPKNPISVIDEFPFMDKNGLVVDILYSPRVTPLLDKANKSGLSIMNGELMLLFQAVPAFEKWFNNTPEVSDDLIATVYGNQALSLSNL